jgi:hypothetical protein
MIVEYSRTGRKVLAVTSNKLAATRKALILANKKQSSNIYIEAQILGSIMK